MLGMGGAQAATVVGGLLLVHGPVAPALKTCRQHPAHNTVWGGISRKHATDSQGLHVVGLHHAQGTATLVTVKVHGPHETRQW